MQSKQDLVSNTMLRRSMDYGIHFITMFVYSYVV